MLFNSYLQIPSIGASTEKRIWESGAISHKEFVANPPTFLSDRKRRLILDHIGISESKISGNDAKYFTDNLPANEHWRLFGEFQSRVAYIDIETTGLGNPGDIITTIALYDGRDVKYYVNGDNLCDFANDVYDYDVIVSFNGKTFDVPFIEKFFNIKLEHAHLDLRYILKSLGYSGGLKACERELGIGRKGSVADVDGFFAVILWGDYKKTGNLKSLETLLSYNIEDVINLEYLMICSYNNKIKELPVNQKPVPIPEKMKNPFKTDDETIRRLKQSSYHLIY